MKLLSLILHHSQLARESGEDGDYHYALLVNIYSYKWTAITEHNGLHRRTDSVLVTPNPESPPYLKAFVTTIPGQHATTVA